MTTNSEKKEKNIFLILCVMRSGSTFLTTLLNKFPEVSSDYEFQWKPTFQTITNFHKIIPGFRTDVKMMLKKSLEDRNTPTIGSKLVFSGSRKYTRLDFIDLGIAINKDIKIIYLKRRPKDIVLSMIKSQGHNINKESNLSEKKNIILESIKGDNVENQSLNKFEFNINMLINNFFLIKQNQKNMKKFCEKHKNYIEIKYEDMNEKLIDISKFLGLENKKEEIDQLIKKAPIIKNKFIDLSEICKNHSEINFLLNTLEQGNFFKYFTKLLLYYKLRLPFKIFSYFKWKIINFLNEHRVRRRLLKYFS